MIPKIQNSQRFIEDYNNFQKKISEIDDNDYLKRELTDALSQLKNNVIYIDRCHDQMMINARISPEVSEIREEIIKLKSLLEQKLSVYQRSKNIKPELRPNEE
jgi:hypothetical protein